MELTIKFSNINIVILSEIRYILKHSNYDIQKIDEINSKIKNIINKFYIDPNFELFSKHTSPSYVDKLVENRHNKNKLQDYFSFLFRWSATVEGHSYWSNIYNIINKYYSHVYKHKIFNN